MNALYTGRRVLMSQGKFWDRHPISEVGEIGCLSQNFRGLVQVSRQLFRALGAAQFSDRAFLDLADALA